MEVTFLFLIVVGSLLLIQKYKEGNWINLVSILMGPYWLIVFFNNLFVSKMGFYRISDEVLIMLMFSFIFFFFGSLIFSVQRRFYSKSECWQMLQRYDLIKMRKFLGLVGFLGIAKLLYLIHKGSFYIDFDEMEGVMTSGIVGHLLLASFSVLPIYILYYSYDRKITNLFPIILILIITFSGFIKYTIMGVFVSLFIFLLLYRRDMLKRAMIILVGLVFITFFSNYAIGFALSGTEVAPDFFIQHFWKYFSGSVIYSNYNFTIGIGENAGIGYKIMTFLCALPNMFLSLFNEVWFPYKGQEMLPVSDIGEESNVVDAIGYLFPSKSDIIEVFLFYIVLFLLGLLFSYIYKTHTLKKPYFDTFIANFLCYFVFFSFFGTFYINSGPWEIISYSLFVPKFFYKHEKNTVQHIRA